MKQNRFTLTLLFVIGYSLAALAQGVITGDKLNIGSGNELNSQYFGGAIGIENSSVGANSLAIGYRDTIPDGSTNSFAVGAHNRVEGINSFAIGGMTKTFGNNSIGLGYFLKTQASHSAVVGWGLQGNNTNSHKFLINDQQNTLMIGFHSTKPTLTVGPSPNDYPNGDHFDLTGKVAIGDVPVPDIAAKLHIRSDEGEDAGVFLEPKDMETGSAFLWMRDEGHSLSVDNDGVMRLRSMEGENQGQLVLEGRVGINIDNLNDTYALAVNGGILTNEVFIKEVENWYDNVLQKDYNLMPLSDLRNYIDHHNHLPEVPSEAEVTNAGYNMAEMQGILLKKIEELTLYTLQQQERIEQLEHRINELEGK